MLDMRHMSHLSLRHMSQRTRIQSAVALSLVIGVLNGSSASQRFEVASIKINQSKDSRAPQNALRAFPAAGRLTITNMTVAAVIKKAYGLQSFELAHNDSPVLNQRIDIEA